jgi:hypothetical protein
MCCIFCKDPSDNSRSVEHIISESLGNKEHILPPGVVCDRCNNYFSRKIEEPLLNSPFFLHARFGNWIENKEGRIPMVSGVALPLPIHVGMRRERDHSTSIGAVNEADNNKWVSLLQQKRKFSVLFLAPTVPNDVLMARFLGKAGLEALAAGLLQVPGGFDEIIGKTELDALRRFVRIGDHPKAWPVNCRPLYDEGHTFSSPHGDYQILHEYTLLYTLQAELYFILALFGYEFVFNMGGPEVGGYTRWLAENNYASPLYLESPL